MNVKKWVIGSIVAGGITLSATGAYGYHYVSELNKQLDTYVLPNTTFEGIPLAGKSKQEVQAIIQQKVEEWNQRKLTYSLKNTTNSYTWKELGVEYRGTDAAESIFKNQKGTILERYNLRKQAKEGQARTEYHLEAALNSSTYDAFIQDKYNDLVSNPQDASLSIAGTNVSITPSIDGEKVDKEKLKHLTADAVEENTVGIELPLTAVKPERTTEDIENLGIKEVIAEYKTPTNGRNANQLFNEKKAAGVLTGAIVAPGEVFSFNGRVGVTDAANGYKLAGTYVNGKVVQAAGGGVCQISSTLYGAVIRADLAIVERSNHSMPVGYVPLGQDATVADYGPDLKFQNNTGHHIYIQSSVEGGQAVTRIFGTHTGKTVNISSQVVSNNGSRIVAVTYKTVKQNGQVIESSLLNRSVYKAHS